jgi:hypothetical protein
MYIKPKLDRFGTFRELTRQGVPGIADDWLGGIQINIVPNVLASGA